MKYLKSALSFIITLFLSLTVTALVLLNIISPLFSATTWKSNLAKTDVYKESAEKLQKGIESVSSASGIKPEAMTGLITPELIKAGTEMFLNESFDYITSKKASVDAFDSSTLTGVLKTKVEDYAKSLSIKIDSSTQQSIDHFLKYCGDMYKAYSEPFVFFDNVLPIMKTAYHYKTILPPFLIAFAVVLILILLLINLKNKSNTIIYAGYGITASGMMLIALYVAARIVTASGKTIIELPILKLFFNNIINMSLLYGILLFIISQIALFMIFYIRRKKSAAKH